MNDSDSKVMDVDVGTKAIEPTIDLNKSFYINEDLDIDLKQVEDPDMDTRMKDHIEKESKIARPYCVRGLKEHTSRVHEGTKSFLCDS